MTATTLRMEDIAKLAKEANIEIPESKEELENHPLMEMHFKTGDNLIMFNQPADAVGWAIDYNGTAKLVPSEPEIGYRLPVVLENDRNLVYLKITQDDSGHIAQLLEYDKKTKKTKVINDFVWDKELEPLPVDRMKLMVMIYAFCKNMMGRYVYHEVKTGEIRLTEFAHGTVTHYIDKLGFFSDKDNIPFNPPLKHLMVTFNNSSVLKTAQIDQIKGGRDFVDVGGGCYQHRNFIVEFTNGSPLLKYLFNGETWMVYQFKLPEMIPMEDIFQTVWWLSMTTYKNSVYYSEAITNAFINGPRDINAVIMEGKESLARIELFKIAEHKIGKES